MVQICSSSYSLGTQKIDIKNYLEEIGRPQEVLKRTGFDFVHHLSHEETIEDLVNDAFNNLNCSHKDDFDTLIYVTQTANHEIPGPSTIFLKNLNSERNILNYDLSDGCTGFLQALELASILISSGKSKKIVIICADQYSRLYTKKSTHLYPIFSDSASVTCVEKNSTYSLNFKTFNRFSDYEQLCTSDKSEVVEEKLKMNGLGLLYYIKNFVSQEVKKECNSSSLTCNDTNFISHQASRIAVETLNEESGINNLIFNTPQLGNLTSSSIPQQLKDNKLELEKNNRSFFITFGIGLKTKLALYEKK
jgi:3-oxoacyl-[acyl-carrier-protein] synthase-3